MPLNTPISDLDANQIVKRVFNVADDAIRVSLGDTLGMAMNISSAAGDSITSVGNSITQKASITSANTGTIINAFSVVGMSSFNLYTNSTSAVVGPQAVTLQVSPSDTDNVWIAVSLTATPSTSSGTVVMGTALTNVVARRARVVVAGALTSGTVDVYVVGRN